MSDMKEKACGCINYEVGPPVYCEKHQSKANKKAEREQAREEKGLRKIVAQQALDLGHDLSPFREYGSRPGKWTAHCHSCGGLVIVYDTVPEFGDQIGGPAVFKACQRSTVVSVLGDAEREAIAARFRGAEATDCADVG